MQKLCMPFSSEVYDWLKLSSWRDRRQIQPNSTIIESLKNPQEVYIRVLMLHQDDASTLTGKIPLEQDKPIIRGL